MISIVTAVFEKTELPSSLLLFFLSFTFPSPIKELKPPGLITQMPVSQMSVGGATDCEPEH